MRRPEATRRQPSDDDTWISYYSALLIISEIGEIGKFEESSSLVGYSGPTSSTNSFGGKTYYGPIMKTGSANLRWILAQCARRSNMRAEPDGTVAQLYARIARKKRDKKAIVTASAKLLEIVFWVLEKSAYHS